MRCFFQASVSNFSNPRLWRLLLCILPSPSSLPNPHHIHHTASSTHLGVPCLRPIISNYHTGSFSHLGVAHLRPIIPINHPDSISIPVAVLLHTHLPTSPLPTFSLLKVFQGGPNFFLLPLGATTLSSSDPLLHTLSPLHIPQIRDLVPPTAPRLHPVALCKS